ncbi:MAG: lipid II flippase MurJ [Xanthobacteraceae bacterium]
MTTQRHSIRKFIAILVSGALASKLLGFGREILMAQVLGASLVADGFRGATAVVFIPLVFLQNESIPAIMIPMQRDNLHKGDGPRRLAALAVALAVVSAILALVVEAAGEIWVDAIVGGFTPAGRSLTLDFVRIMSLAMPASVVLNVLAAGEIAIGRTRLTNIRASILNLSVLAGIAILMLTGEARALAWSFAAAFNGLALWGGIMLWRDRELSFAGLTLDTVRGAATEFFKRLRPLIALPLGEQANSWVERLLTSRITTGAVASLDYARTLTESALLLVSQPVGLAVLSTHGSKDTGQQVETIARPILALAVPMSAFLVVFAPEIVRLIFFRGAFSEQAVALTSYALRGIAVGLWAATLAWILIRVLNGAGRNVSATVVIVSAYATNIVVNYLLSQLHASGATALLLIASGESTRSFVMLAGVLVCLGGRRKLLGLIAVALVPAALMLLLGWQIENSIIGVGERLLTGVLAYAACAVMSVSMLVPALRDAALERLGLMNRPKEKCP